MTLPLRVLYLCPPGRQSGRVSRYGFLDEEIRAIVDRGIEAYAVSTAEDGDWDDDRLHVRTMPPETPRDRVATLAFLARHASHIDARNVGDARWIYRCVRIEYLAARLAREHGVSLIHSFFGWPGGFGGLLAAADRRIPFIAGLRGADVNMRADLGYGGRLVPSFDRNLRRLLRAADATASNSDFVRRQALALGAPSSRAHVILKGVRLDQFAVAADRQAARDAVGAGEVPMLLAVSGLVRIKGLDDVLDALAQVRASGRSFSCVICGEGPERTRLESKVEHLGLSGCVRLVGSVPHEKIASYFAAADLFVHGAVIEAAGNVLLEAMASGCPVVCTDAGGPAEYVEDGVSGFVVPVGDTAAICERVCRLIDDGTLRAAQGRAGRARVFERFSYDRMIDDTVELYASVSTPRSLRTQSS